MAGGTGRLASGSMVCAPLQPIDVFWLNYYFPASEFADSVYTSAKPMFHSKTGPKGRGSAAKMPERTPLREPDDRTAVAHYVASLSGDLALMARRHGLTTLSYLLEMARLEAEDLNRRGRSGLK
jgi:hypothetical protein